MNMKMIKYVFFAITITLILTGLGLATTEQITEIRTCGELQAIEGNLKGNYVVMNNIDCEGYNFEPIGDRNNPFQGTIHGRYNKVLNLNITRDKGNLGLFSHIGKNGEVINLDLVRMNVKSSSSDVGGLAGENRGLIKGSQVVFSTIKGNSFVGGLVGYMGPGGEIVNSVALSTDVYGSSAVGGLVGLNLDGVINSSRAGVSHWSPSTLESSFYGAGGLVGINDDGSKIINSYANVDVYGPEEVGGLVGRQASYTSKGTVIENSYSMGPVSGEDEETVGGLLGYETGDNSQCYGNFWDLDTSNQQNSRCGTGKPTEDMKRKSTFTNAGWDFENVWEMREDGYPQLRMKDPILEPVEISTCKELQNIGPSGTYKLSNDIDCSNIDNFEPIIANTGGKFSFNGQGHTIKNVNINRPEEDYVGLFGHLKYNVLVENVGVEDVNIEGKNYVGGLIGRQSYQAVVKDAYATGTVEGNKDVGGLVGHKYDDLTSSWADANVKGNENVGSVVGRDRKGKSDYFRESTKLTLDIQGQGEIETDPHYNYYRKNEEITLTAEADENWYFKEWTGDHEGTDEEVTIKMDQDKEITAHFTEEEPSEYYELTVNIEGEGSVEIDPDQEEYEEGEEVELKAIPDENWYFKEWTGDYEGTDEEVTITMDNDKTITAHFTEEEPPEYYELTVNVEGEGEVLIDPDQEEYEEGESVLLIAIPDEGHKFEKWTGDATGTQKETTIIMDDDKTVTAHFTDDEEPPKDDFFRIEIISPKDGAEFEENEEIELHYFVENTGDEKGSQYIQFRVNEDLEDIRYVTLEPGEVRHGIFNWSTDKPGEYELEVKSKNHRDRIDVQVGEIPELKAELISPEDGAKDIGREVDLKVNITHSEDDPINVTFVDRNENKRMKTYENVENGSTVTHEWKNLEENKTYRWYVILESEDESTSSRIWRFTTKEKFPSRRISVSAGGDVKTTVNTPVELRGTASSHRSRITKYRWDFNGDGEWNYESTETGITEAIYEEPGTYRAKFEATDENNHTNYDTTTVRVREEIYFVPRETVREALNPIQEAGVRITPIYEYDPHENTTKITYNIREMENEEKYIRIKMDIPTKVASTVEELRIRPRPDEEETKNLISWETSLAPLERTEIEMQKEGYIPKQHIEEIKLNIREIEEPEEPEDPEEPTTIAGLVIGAFASPAAGAIVLIAIIILSLGYYKREDIKERLDRNLNR